MTWANFNLFSIWVIYVMTQSDSLPATGWTQFPLFMRNKGSKKETRSLQAIINQTFFWNCNIRSSRGHGKENNRSCQPEVFCKKGLLENFAKFTGKHLCQNLFFNKVAGLRCATLLKEKLWNRCFPGNFAKFLRTPFL